MSNSFEGAQVDRVQLSATTIAYRRIGSGPAMVFVHGFPLSGFTWRKIVPVLAERFTCYLTDLPGLGESEWTADTDFSFPGQGDTLKEFVDALGLERYSIVAQDTGGTFARYMALEDVLRVDKLILLNTEMPGHRPPYIPMYQALMRIPFATKPFRLLLRSRTFLRSAMGFGGCFNDLSLIEGEFHEHVVKPLLESDALLEGMRQYLIGAHWPPVDALKEEHARLTMPTRLVWGADDPTFPIGLAREMAGQFPDCDVVEIPDARLLVHEEQPEAVADALLSLYKKRK